MSSLYIEFKDCEKFYVVRQKRILMLRIEYQTSDESERERERYEIFTCLCKTILSSKICKHFIFLQMTRFCPKYYIFLAHDKKSFHLFTNLICISR